ncbi:LysR family transcriptional regulator [Pelagibius litoralis]|uniref:LysR family transcriptional regulator n=1 Tax=Pelagibius litoralis TaxID=374515 RepID=A0A967EXP2_9PROT|nr:LysR family transcriptional regulator [Pelagibius litoralis]NIA69310.1 LysR family transcriptional regulator [Pelagibius litoralis]
MDVKSLYTLIAAADCGSFAEAGLRLGVSISAVSLQLRALEEETGLALFDRRTRPPQLTDEGRDFVARAREVLAHWETLSDGLSRDPAGGVLRVGAVHTAVAAALPAALLQLQGSRPELSVRLATGLSHDLEEQLKRRIIDCAVVTEAEAQSEELTSHRIGSEPLALIAHRSIKGRDIRKILESQPYVRFSRQARVARLIESELQRRGIAVASRMEIDTLDAVVSLVRNQLGVSIVPLNAGGDPLPKDLRSLPLGSPPILRHLAVAARKDSPKAHLVSLLVEALRSVYANRAAA